MVAMFVSHGAPDIALTENATTAFWRQLGAALPPPSRIVVLSAHWLTSMPQIGAATRLQTVHDFSGFDPSLSQLTYPAHGDPLFAEQLRQRWHDGQLTLSATQGLDHGAWIPLRYLRPQADVPVLPLSLPSSWTPAQLWAWGQSLSPYLDDAWLLCSGASSHNLRAIFSRETNGLARMMAFRDWLLPRIAENDRDALCDYRQRAPEAVWNHPSDEHLRPLFVVLGAASGRKANHHHSETTYGLLPMDHWWWA